MNNRGVAYQKKGEYDLAIADLDEAIRLDPAYAESLANRAETYLKKAMFDRAAQDFDAAIKLTPDLVGIWNGRRWARCVWASSKQRSPTATKQSVAIRPRPRVSIRRASSI